MFSFHLLFKFWLFQSPAVFNTSIRNNLDPEGIYSDKELWNCLEISDLDQLIKSMPDGLQSNCSNDNLSLGQRQLLCLARAILRR